MKIFIYSFNMWKSEIVVVTCDNKQYQMHFMKNMIANAFRGSHIYGITDLFLVTKGIRWEIISMEPHIYFLV